MPVKSILEVDISDDKFVAFKRLFDQYNAAVKGLPKAWKAAGESADETVDSFKALVGITSSVAQAARLIEKANEASENSVERQEKFWERISRYAKNTSTATSTITDALLRWVGVSSILGGLVGGGTLFGLDRLAQNVSGTRRASARLGTNIGSFEAFKTSFGRFTDPESLLTNIAEAQYNPSKRTPLISAGLTKQQIEGDPTQAAIAVLRHVQRLADTIDPRQLGGVLHGRQLDQLLPGLDVQGMRGKSAELEELIKKNQTSTKQLNVLDATAKRWADFDTILDNTGKAIKTHFVNGLVDLTGPLSKLSAVVADFAGILLRDGGPLHRWIKAAAGGLETFAKYIGEPKFEKDVSDFIDRVGKITEAFGRVIVGLDKFLGWFSSQTTSDKTGQGIAVAAATFGKSNRVAPRPGESLWPFFGTKPDAAAPAVPGHTPRRPYAVPYYGLDDNEIRKKYMGEYMRAYHGEPFGQRVAPARPAQPEYRQGPGALAGYAPAVVRIENVTGGNTVMSINGVSGGRAG